MFRKVKKGHFMTGATGGDYLLPKRATGSTGGTGSTASTGSTGSPASTGPKASSGMTGAMTGPQAVVKDPEFTGPAGDLQVSSEFGTEGNVIGNAKKIIKKLRLNDKVSKEAKSQVLPYMESMKDDAEKLILKTTEEYAPVAKNCSAHYHAFYRVANKTEEVLASIKSQEVYQNETDALKEKIRKYTDQLSNAKEQYANETLEQNALSLEKENKTMECFSHLDLHKRMVKMLKKLKKAMSAVKSNKNGSPSLLKLILNFSRCNIGKRIWIKVNEYIEE